MPGWRKKMKAQNLHGFLLSRRTPDTEERSRRGKAIADAASSPPSTPASTSNSYHSWPATG
ncbi:hypothetical protein KFK09_010577 [Dendrobium nobile]|uniref:Uncharacterized protein n=1 Tax=Dendrobium nobile TaxID=94219 RepID=A0A8T3BCE8_DENNO|nr:hypothetical protein KFK09_010577 [Dendrobium nobile]